MEELLQCQTLLQFTCTHSMFSVAAPEIFSGERGPDSSQGGPSKHSLHTPTASLQCEVGGGHWGQPEKWGRGAASWPPVDPVRHWMYLPAL